jgi:hypothetical protein
LALSMSVLIALEAASAGVLLAFAPMALGGGR